MLFMTYFKKESGAYDKHHSQNMNNILYMTY